MNKLKIIYSFHACLLFLFALSYEVKGPCFPYFMTKGELFPCVQNIAANAVPFWNPAQLFAANAAPLSLLPKTKKSLLRSKPASGKVLPLPMPTVPPLREIFPKTLQLLL